VRRKFAERPSLDPDSFYTIKMVLGVYSQLGEGGVQTSENKKWTHLFYHTAKYDISGEKYFCLTY